MLPITLCPEKYNTVAILAQCSISLLVQSTPHQEVQKSSVSRVPNTDISERCPYTSLHLKQHDLVEKLKGLSPTKVQSIGAVLQVEGENVASYPLMVIFIRHHRLRVLTPVVIHPNWSSSVVLFAATTARQCSVVEARSAKVHWLLA
jgi:hypothetical protein